MYQYQICNILENIVRFKITSKYELLPSPRAIHNTTTNIIVRPLAADNQVFVALIVKLLLKISYN